MKEVYRAMNVTEAYVVQGILDAAGIKAVVQGESLGPLRGILPITIETSPGIWILDDAQAARAGEILAEYFARLAQQPDDNQTWTCSGCGEELEPQFTECWSCGQSRSGPFR